ncbi:MAG: hypothetical protein HY827_03540 [Actinobacteria bacterium]|nr:hypothetical protein [Actinomycetota bacterium]
MKSKFALAFALALCSAAAVFPSGASAASYSYCGNVLGPDSWCGTYYNYDVTYNRATYPGGGTVRVGIKQILKSDGSTVNRKFADNYVATNSSNWTARPFVANASGSNHTVNGYFEYTSGPYNARLGGKRKAPRARSSAASLFDPQSRLAATAKSFGIGPSDVAIARNDIAGEFAVARGITTRCLAKSRGDDYVESCSPVFNGGVSSTQTITEDSSNDVPAGLSRVTGIAPDGAATVIVRLGYGPAKSLVVVGGVFTGFVRGTADQPVSVTPAS